MKGRTDDGGTSEFSDCIFVKLVLVIRLRGCTGVLKFWSMAKILQMEGLTCSVQIEVSVSVVALFSHCLISPYGNTAQSNVKVVRKQKVINK